MKKRQQNLKYEFTQHKLKARKTGEEGLNDIKENSSYYSIFYQTMGNRDSVDPAQMEIESSSFILSTFIPSTSAGVKRGRSDVRGEESRKKKLGKVTKLMRQMTEMHSKKCGRKVFIMKINVLKSQWKCSKKIRRSK